MAGMAHISCTKYRNLKNISHYHSDYELVYINKGRAAITIGETTFHVNEKQGAFICGNDIHCIISDENTLITVLKIDSKYFENVFATKTLRYPIIRDGSIMEDMLESVRAELIFENDNNDVMADCISIQLLVTLFRKEKTVARSGQLLNKPNSHLLYDKICRKIFDNYSTITFGEVAEHLHFSEPYFSKVFHNIFGMTFTQYLNTVKIAAAIERLKENKMSITEIALECGFNTIRHFNRVFKNFTGYAPNRLPPDYVFLYRLQDGYGLDPTLNCTVVIEK